MKMISRRDRVAGVMLDAQKRCAHYRGETDVIAIRMMCCGTYYACKDCHDALADHAVVVWPRERWGELAVLCGVCSTQMSVRDYLACENRCPTCGASFNPHCRDHYSSYFETDREARPAD